MHKPGVSLARWTFVLLLATSPLFAQSGQVLKGGVQQNATPPTDQQVQTVVLDSNCGYSGNAPCPHPLTVCNR